MKILSWVLITAIIPQRGHQSVTRQVKNYLPALSTNTTTNHRANDFFIMDRSFIRLQNIELAHNFTPSLLKTLRVQGVRTYISAYNFFTWDKLRLDHLDPENSESLGYPVTKSLNFGVNITF